MTARLVQTLDRWLFERFRMSATSLSAYRIMYATYLLLFIFPDFSWVGGFPSSFYAAPPGPLRLLNDFPPTSVLVALEVALAVAAVCLLFGFRTRTASLAVGLLLFTGLGFEYSMGKINHGWLLFRIVPLCLAFSSWGARFSLDAVQGRVRRRPLDDGWPVALLALLTGFALLTAAVPKIQAGWLDPANQAVRGYVVRNISVHDREPLLAQLVLRIEADAFWAVLDIATVVIEAGLVVALLSPVAFRVLLALLVLFHAGVYLTMAITFSIAVVAYGAFVRWDRALPSSLRREAVHPTPATSGSPPSVSAPSGSAPSGSAPSGSAPSGSAPSGSAGLRRVAERPVPSAVGLLLLGVGLHAVSSWAGPPVSAAWAWLAGTGPKGAHQLSLLVGTAIALGYLGHLGRRIGRPGRH